MKQDKLWLKARKLSGLAHFERTETRKTEHRGRMMLAYNVPGTREHGHHEMLQEHARDIVKRLRKAEKQGC